MKLKITLDEVHAIFECEKCGDKVSISFLDVIQGGVPMCIKHDEPVEMIPENEILLDDSCNLALLV